MHQDQLPRSSDHGLVIVAVDSCHNGTGWILYQNVEKEKHLVIFGSCTFNDAESRYSQAKLELYGVFRAVKDLRHRIWGIHIHIDVDTKLHWISYIALFDYVMNHVPAQSHAGVDGLSRRKRAPKDSEDEDAEEYLDKFMGSAFLDYSSFSSSSLTNFLSSESLHAFWPTHLDNNFFQDLLLTMRRTSCTPYVSFHTSSIADDLSVLSVVDPLPSLAAELQNIKQVHYDPSLKDWSRGSLVKCSLLSITDDFLYTGHEFEHQKICPPVLVTCSLGEETFTMEMCQYQCSYMLSLKPGAPQPTVTDQSVVPGIPDPTLRTDN